MSRQICSKWKSRFNSWIIIWFWQNSNTYTVFNSSDVSSFLTNQWIKNFHFIWKADTHRTLMILSLEKNPYFRYTNFFLQVKNPINVRGTVARGSLRVLMNSQGILESTLDKNLSAVICANDHSVDQTIYLCTWSDTDDIPIIIDNYWISEISHCFLHKKYILKNIC